MVAGREVTPKDAEGVARLKQYWAHGPGAAKIQWGRAGGGDFERCITKIQEAVSKDGKPPLPDAMIRGLCYELHKEATGGFAPGHAPGE